MLTQLTARAALSRGGDADPVDSEGSSKQRWRKPRKGKLTEQGVETERRETRGTEERQSRRKKVICYVEGDSDEEIFLQKKRETPEKRGCVNTDKPGVDADSPSVTRVDSDLMRAAGVDTDSDKLAGVDPDPGNVTDADTTSRVIVKDRKDSVLDVSLVQVNKRRRKRKTIILSSPDTSLVDSAADRTLTSESATKLKLLSSSGKGGFLHVPYYATDSLSSQFAINRYLAF